MLKTFNAFAKCGRKSFSPFSCMHPRTSTADSNLTSSLLSRRFLGACMKKLFPSTFCKGGESFEHHSSHFMHTREVFQCPQALEKYTSEARWSSFDLTACMSFALSVCMRILFWRMTLNDWRDLQRVCISQGSCVCFLLRLRVSLWVILVWICNATFVMPIFKVK